MDEISKSYNDRIFDIQHIKSTFLLYNSLCFKINRIELDIAKDSIITDNFLKQISNDKYKINDTILESLKADLDNFSKYCSSFISDSSSFFCKNTTNLLSTNNWENIDGLNGQKCNSAELLCAF